MPSPRTLAFAGAVLLVVALAYVAARTTPLFAVDTVEVRGASPRVASEVETAVARFLGTSLVALDGDELLRRVESLPTVVSARYDRAFPHTLRVFVTPERPVALVAHRGTRWVVSERARVMRPAGPEEARAYARIPVELEQPPTPGAAFEEPSVLEPLRVLATVDKTFPVRIRTVRLLEGSLTLVLATKTEVRLGDADDLDLKLASAASVLRALSMAELAELAYIDVSLPERPVAGTNPQVAG